ncbi:MAG: hypothetical protein IJL17_00980 [Kiritimatiellae bacterium]|nr:hypothetical protein [Kiritimatiellia bacterium]
MDQNEIAVFQQAIVACEDPAEIARKVKRTFKRMPGEMALACFARVMTAELLHPIKVAVWDAVRYSHIWWGVDAVLQGPVMENPIVQQAFADAVPMRRWIVANRLPGWEITQMTVDFHVGMGFDSSRYSPLQMLIHALTSYDDDFLAAKCRNALPGKELSFVDCRGNNLLWYLTYRDDQNAAGGFACPKTVAALLERGVDPNRRNNLGLCWNDIARHVVRPVVRCGAIS